MSNPLNRQISSNNLAQQRQELERLSALLTDEEFQLSSTASGVLKIFAMVSGPVQIFDISTGCLEEFGSFLDDSTHFKASEQAIFLETNDFQLEDYCVGSVKHLPAVRVDFRYPATYPSDSPPEIALSCDWMDSQTLRFFERHARTLWMDNGHLPVMHDFYESLRKILDESKAGPMHRMLILIPEDDEFLKCYVGSVMFVKTADEFAERLISYSNYREETVFARQLQQCPVCFEWHMGKSFMKHRNCGHRCCAACLKNNSETQITEESTRRVHCFMCQAKLHLPDVSDLIPEDKQDTLQCLRQDFALTRMGDVVDCPDPECTAIVIKDGADTGQCQCGFAFCALCQKSISGIDPCTADEDKEEETDTEEDNYIYSPVGGSSDGDIDENYHESYFKRDRVLNTVMDMGLMDRVKKCPDCMTYIQKVSGCNHVVCRCGVHFCWGCLGPLRAFYPYSHIGRTESSQCFDDMIAGRLDYLAANSADIRAIDDLADELLLPTPELWFNEAEERNQLRAALAPYFLQAQGE